MRNLTGDSLLDDSLQQAFRISLEQSRYVNVVSERRSRQALRMMRKDPSGTQIDRVQGSEIAMRTGAAALLMPTVADIGGHTRMTVEVVDPTTQETVFVASAEERGHDASLQAVDAVTMELRQRLGESSIASRKNSVPLPEATTSSMVALRAYALGQKRFNEGDYTGAIGFYQKAIELDPQFALAWLGEVRSRFVMGDTKNGLVGIKRAGALRARLPPREAMYLDGWSKELLAPDQALITWVQMAAIYPDYAPAQHNASILLGNDNRFREALPYSMRAVQIPHELANVGLDQLARVKLAIGDYDGALSAATQAKENGYGAAARRVAMAAAAKRDFSLAERALAGMKGPDPEASIERTSVATDQGKLQDAQRYAQAGLDVINDKTGFDYRRNLLLLATAENNLGRDPMTQLREVRKLALAALKQGAPGDAQDDVTLALSAAILAARRGDDKFAAGVLQDLKPYAGTVKARIAAELTAVVRAWILLDGGQGDPAEARRIIQPYLDDNSRYQSRVVALEIMRRSGDVEGAHRETTWLRDKRGLAYAEIECGYCLQTLNVKDSNAVLAAGAGHPKALPAVALP